MKMTRLILFLFVFVSAGVFAEPAVMFTHDSCTILDGDGNIITTNDATFRVVNSRNGSGGNINQKCHVKGLENSTGQKVRWNADNTGFGCFSLDFGQITYDWNIEVSPKGNAMMSCKFHFD